MPVFRTILAGYFPNNDAEDERNPNLCPLCAGRGSFIHGGGVALSSTPCPLCKGTGEYHVPEDACPTCGGYGKLLQSENVMRSPDGRMISESTCSWLEEKKCPTCQGSGKKP